MRWDHTLLRLSDLPIDLKEALVLAGRQLLNAASQDVNSGIVEYQHPYSVCKMLYVSHTEKPIHFARVSSAYSSCG